MNEKRRLLPLLAALYFTLGAGIHEGNVDVHGSSHQENATDEIFGENLGTACTINQIWKSDGAGGVDCAADADSGGAPVWSALTDPSTDLTLAMSDNETTFNWVVAQDATNVTGITFGLSKTVNPSIRTEYVVEMLMNDSGGDHGGINAILHIDNKDTDDPVSFGLFIDSAGAGGIINAISVTAANITNIIATGTYALTFAELGRLDGLVGEIVTDTTVVTEVDGDGLQINTSTLDVDLNATLDGVGSTGNLSGLEFTATGELALLQGCNENDNLFWDNTAATWDCQAEFPKWNFVDVPSADLTLNMSQLQTQFDWAVTIDSLENLFTLSVDYTAPSSTFATNLLLLERADSGGDHEDWDRMLVIQNLDTNDGITSAVFIASNGGTIGSAFNINDSDITNVFVLDGTISISQAEMAELDGVTTIDGVGITNVAGSLDFDATEILGTTTWGGGAAQTFIWNVGATDPTFAFTSDDLTITNTATLGATATAASFLTVSTEPSTTPSVDFDDSDDGDDGTRDAAVEVNCPTTDNCDLDLIVESGAGNEVALVHIDSVGGATSLQLGDGGVTNYINIDEGGVLTLVGSASLPTVTGLIAFSLETPVTGDSGELRWMAPVNVSITQIACDIDAGTASINIEERTLAAPNSAGTDVLSSDLVCNATMQTACASGCDVDTITNATIDQDDPVALTISIGTAGWLRVYVRYTVD